MNLTPREYFEVPTTCPICSGSLTVDTYFLYCRSKSCPSKLLGAVKVWIERLGLLHWGDAMIEKLTDQDNPKINTLSDLYRLSVDELATCCSGIKMAQKCYDTLHAQKKIPLQLLISALNVPNLGISTATDIVQNGVGTIDKLLSMKSDDFQQIPNIGQVTAQLIEQGIIEKAEIIRGLAEVVEIQGPIQGILTGKSFCITGALSKPRKSIEKAIMDAGGTVKTSVGSDTTFLITNEPGTNSSKMKNAKKHGVKVISENEFFEMLAN